jgi:site-specific recombinase XerD
MSITARLTETPLARLNRATSVTDAACFEATLRARRLASTTIARYLQVVAHFAEWRTASATTTAEAVPTFLSGHLPRCTCPCPGRRAVTENRAALQLWLRATGAEPSSPHPRTPVDAEVTAYDGYLRDVCGAALQTRLHRTRHVRAWLTQLFGDQTVRYDDIRPFTLTSFVTMRAQQVTPSTAGVIASDLRSYLRHLALRGVAVEGLAESLPRVAQWRLASVPKHLSPNDLTRLLAAFDRGTPRSCRDYAMAMCLVTWGLRASEVAGLRLTDIDWRLSTVTIRATKTHRARMMPLTPTVGEAVARYLRVRPATTSDHVFVRIGVLDGEALGPSVVRSAMRLGYRRAGLPASFSGTHRLRHTAATRLVNAGASIKEVADVLGHASLDTTAVYAKVDLRRLRQVAMPWPEVSQ